MSDIYNSSLLPPKWIQISWWPDSVGRNSYVSRPRWGCWCWWHSGSAHVSQYCDLGWNPTPCSYCSERTLSSLTLPSIASFLRVLRFPHVLTLDSWRVAPTEPLWRIADLDTLKEWLVVNKLSLNVAKTEFMIIGSKPMMKSISNSLPNIKIDDKSISQVNECKTLGVIIDQHLSWKNNTNYICKKITSGISALRRLKDFVDKDSLLSVYNSTVRPYFDYCCEVWDGFGETQSKRLQKLQNRSARIITNMSNDVDHSIALHALNWEPLKVQRKRANSKMMFKILNNMGPKCLSNLFTFRSDVSDYDLRDTSLKLSLPKPRTNSMKKSFLFDGAKLWNSLPEQIRRCTSFTRFETKIAAHSIAYST